ncbi:MAG: FHA domain-containing protein [Ktedonobacterales bacterium]|nr:FHA domain-containing protein [Ktedonobacterales bacterium]
MYYVEVETPEGIRRIQLTRDRMSIGRLSYNDVVLPSAQISRQHAELRRVNGEWWIADLHSTNGLRFNSERIQERRLSPGDCVMLAPSITIRFLSAASPPAVPPDALPWRAAPAPAISLVPSAGGGAMSDPRVPSAARRERAKRDGGQGTLPNRGGYPVPRGPLNAGSELSDPFRRGYPADERHRVTAGPAHNLLHVCQTCGQLTAPDAVYCQNCHHSIAYECANCRLSLLPVQERCPRCQAPNPGSVRRAHRTTGI